MRDRFALGGAHFQGDDLFAADLVELNRDGGLIFQEGPLVAIMQGEFQGEERRVARGRRGRTLCDQIERAQGSGAREPGRRGPTSFMLVG
jgi:hypothetical protein